MKTIKVKPWAPGQGDYVVINHADFNPSVHELADGEVLEAAAPGERLPTMAELVAARDALMQRERELDEQALALAQRSADLDAREQALTERRLTNEAEAARLAALAAQSDAAAMTNDQLKAALDAKGIKYPSNATKSDLQALLAGAPA